MAEAVEAFGASLGSRLLAAYALGSLAHGGFSELVSDVDLGLILSDPLEARDHETIETVTAGEKHKGSPLHERLSVFWGTPTTLRGEEAGGRFSALDRLDLIENGRLLAGADDVRLGLPAPSARELLVTGAEFALDSLAAGADAVEEILGPDMLLGRGVRRVTKLVLFPVRFLHTAATGQVGTNDAAVARYLADDRAPSRALVAAALAWRTTPPLSDAPASALLGEQLLPLYLFYIADHIGRLRAIGQAELAAAFEAWRGRLVR